MDINSPEQPSGLGEKTSETPTGKPKTHSRRAVLKGAANLITAVAVDHVVGNPIVKTLESVIESPQDSVVHDDLHDNKKPLHGYMGIHSGGEHVSPSGDKEKKSNGKEKVDLPKDVLSEEELRKNHIRIEQTEETQMHLRKSALKDFKIFKDASEGKLDEVVVVLVPRDYTNNWYDSENFSEQSKLVYQSMLNPLDYIRDEQTSTITWLRGYIEWLRSNIDNVDGERKKEMKEEIAYKEKWLKSEIKYNSGLHEKHPDVIREKIAPKSRYAGLIVNTNEFFKRSDEIDDFWERDKRCIEVGEAHPDVLNKVFVYIAVGGYAKPHPKESWINALSYKANPSGSSRKEYRFTVGTTGQVTRHEFGHYKSPSQSYSEPDADTNGFEGVVEASLRLRDNDDPSGYSIIFVNDEGITYTKNQQKQSSEVPA